ncbi:hypothetical protein [Ferviditalea candida]|uniref:C2H2-type domain-containing protein n=1 Tax=Ferviditalea candida TaxID=3108399 RepID=A0ABU5ZGF3_9BACL|nr:hypothetical protein [Paenibacillaceae bacterium T2]
MNMKCSVKSCGVQNIEFLALLDDGERMLLLCPVHQMEYVTQGLQEEPSLLTYKSKHSGIECELCGSPARYYADEVELHLCGRHLTKLLKRSLSPVEYRMLVDKHGEFALVGEFYYAKGGYALQPL